MIVATAKNVRGQLEIIVGVSEEDLPDLRKGLTKTKQGNPQFGFASLILFMGKTNEEMLAVLQQAGTVRSDDMFPNAGQG